MLYTLIRRDFTWKLTLAMMVAGAIVGFSSVSVSIVLVNPYLICAAMARPHQRATLFEATLPIRARDLFLARTVSLLALVWLPLGTACASFLVAQGAAAWNHILTLAALGTLLSLAILLAISGRIQELKAGGWPLPVLAGALFAGGILLFLEPASNVAVMLISAAFSIFWFWRTWESVPDSFQVAPLEAAEATAPEHHRQYQMAPAFPIWRAIYSWQTLVWFPLLMLLAMTGQWPLACIFVMTYTSGCLGQMSWLLTLPLKRSMLLAYVLVPFAGAMLLGFVLGANRSFDAPVNVGTGEHFHGFTKSDGRSTPTIQLPLEFWRWAPNGIAPEIRAPWGETHIPATVNVLGLTFYNPYSVGPRRSTQFLEWQFGNATEATLGRRLTLADYNSGRLAPDRLQRNGWKPVTRQPRFLILEFMGMWSVSLLLVCGVEVAMWHRVLRLSNPQRRLLTLGPSLGPSLIFVALMFGSSAQGTKDGGMFVLRQALLWLSDALPPGLLPVSVCAAAVVGLLCWIAVKLFEGVEIPNAVPKRGIFQDQAGGV